jgi:hypothetical protein
MPTSKEGYDDYIKANVGCINYHKIQNVLDPQTKALLPGYTAAALLFIRSLAAVHPIILSSALLKPVILSQYLQLPLTLLSHALPDVFPPRHVQAMVDFYDRVPRRYFTFVVMSVVFSRVQYYGKFIRHSEPEQADSETQQVEDAWKKQSRTTLPLSPQACDNCHAVSVALHTLNPCSHTFCVSCYWASLLETSGTSPPCPCCNGSDEALADVAYGVLCTLPRPDPSVAEAMSRLSPSERAAMSAVKFNSLPETLTISDLKKTKKATAKQKEKLTIIPDLGLAYRAFTGSTKPKRMDKFMDAVISCNAMHVAAIVETGVDVDAYYNEYKNSAIHVAVESGDAALVKRLVECGADCGRRDGIFGISGNVLSLILGRGDDTASSSSTRASGMDALFATDSDRSAAERILKRNETLLGVDSVSTVTTLVEPSLDTVLNRGASAGDHHPSEGTSVIDITNEAMLAYIDETIKQLPAAVQKEKIVQCSERRYWWDYSLLLTTFLERALQGAIGGRSVTVLNYFRVLLYEEGGELGAHVDIAKKSLRMRKRGDQSNNNNNSVVRSSTHTLLFYVNDCTDSGGGKTSMLWNERDDGGDSNVICDVDVRRGRLLIFKHTSPHRGNICNVRGKVVVRGECFFD